MSSLNYFGLFNSFSFCSSTRVSNFLFKEFLTIIKKTTPSIVTDITIIKTLDGDPFHYGKEDYANPSILMKRAQNLND